MKKVILIGIIFVSLLILVSCEEQYTSTQKALQEPEKKDIKTEEIDIAIEETKPKKTTYAMDEKIVLDDISYNTGDVLITNLLEYEDIFGDTKRLETDNLFVLVDLTIKNIGKIPKSISHRQFQILDEENKIFSIDDRTYSLSSLGVLNELQPNLEAKIKLLFEISADSKNLKLVIKEDVYSEDLALIPLSSVEIKTGSKEEFKFNSNSVVHTDNEVSLSIDDVKYEIKGDDYAKITSITFSILNEGNDAINPKIYVFFWDDNDEKEDKVRAKKEIEFDIYDDYIEVGEHLTKEAVVSIPFNDIDLTKTLKLTLSEELSYPERAYVSVEKKVEIK